MRASYPKDRRKKPGQEPDRLGYLIQGRRPVLEALRAKRPLKEIWIAENLKGTVLEDLKAEARKCGVPLCTVSRDQLAAMANSQGVVAWALDYVYYELEELLQNAQGPNPLIMVLDHLEDPHNLGAVLRTAEAAGVAGVIIPDRRSVAVTPIVSKISAGASELIPVARVTNIVQTLQQIKQRGFWIFGLEPEASKTIWEADLNLPCALVVGNEGKGISRLAREGCDYLLRLPMQGQIASLNVSVATAVFLYEVMRQRTNKTN